MNATMGNVIDSGGILVPATVCAALWQTLPPNADFTADDSHHRRTHKGAGKELPGSAPFITLRPFTYPYPQGNLVATLATMYDCLRDGQKPHGWLFQANWTMARGGVVERQYGDIHANWPDAAHDHPVGATNKTVRVCMGSRDELTSLFAKGRLHEPTPTRLRKPC
jgi:hypothetical protein